MPFLLSGVTVLPLRVILPARNSTRYLLEVPREPETRLGKRAPDDTLCSGEGGGGRTGWYNLSVTAVSNQCYNKNHEEQKIKIERGSEPEGSSELWESIQHVLYHGLGKKGCWLASR